MSTNEMDTFQEKSSLQCGMNQLESENSLLFTMDVPLPSSVSMLIPLLLVNSARNCFIPAMQVTVLW